MDTMTSFTTPSSDVAFTPSVKAVQSRKGSRDAYARMEAKGGFNTRITPELEQFIGAQTSVFLATANADGQPYIQHRGGPAGFLHVINDNTIAFADYSGNRQFITQGNLLDNPKAYIFLIDYVHQRRVKLWGTARVVEDDPALTASLMPPDYKARPEQTILFHVEAWDTNCPKHIPLRFDAETVAQELAKREARIDALEAEIGQLRSELATVSRAAGS